LDKFNVVLVYPIPEPGWDVPQIIAKYLLYKNTTADLNTSLALYKERNKDVFEIFESINHENLVPVYPSSVFCIEEEGVCLLNDNQGIYYRDNNHLSNYGSDLLAPYIVDAVLEIQNQTNQISE